MFSALSIHYREEEKRKAKDAANRRARAKQSQVMAPEQPMQRSKSQHNNAQQQRERTLKHTNSSTALSVSQSNNLRRSASGNVQEQRANGNSLEPKTSLGHKQSTNSQRPSRSASGAQEGKPRKNTVEGTTAPPSTAASTIMEGMEGEEEIEEANPTNDIE